MGATWRQLCDPRAVGSQVTPAANAALARRQRGTLGWSIARSLAMSRRIEWRRHRGCCCCRRRRSDTPMRRRR